MIVEREINRTSLELHIGVTLLAYAIFTPWLFTGTAVVGFAFLEAWWVTLIFGVLMDY
ncbi:hypothetical protein [Thermococcus sp.]|uniref:hypothetical protein n=1 Tax=Thermococcus sp. TaxID=35749 RepID=UPI0025D60A59|nr:hypothetical protein [Thermococcus sp.]